MGETAHFATALARDRDQLRDALLGEWRDRHLTPQLLEEIGKSFLGLGPDANLLYNLSPAAMMDAGIRVLGRYGIETCFTPHARAIAVWARSLIQGSAVGGPRTVTIVDLFAGTGNLLYHFCESFGTEVFVAFDAERHAVEDMAHNFGAIGVRLDVACVSYPDSLLAFRGLIGEKAREDDPIIFVVDPPWGREGFTFDRGLDLRRTEPRVDHVLRALHRVSWRGSMFVVIKTHELLMQESLVAVSHGYRILTSAVITAGASGTNDGFALLERDNAIDQSSL